MLRKKNNWWLPHPYRLLFGGGRGSYSYLALVKVVASIIIGPDAIDSPTTFPSTAWPHPSAQIHHQKMNYNFHFFSLLYLWKEIRTLRSQFIIRRWNNKSSIFFWWLVQRPPIIFSIRWNEWFDHPCVRRKLKISL